jgi:hypothetical protein
MVATMTYTKLATLGELKAAIRKAGAVYVWCNWEGDDGDYIEVRKAAFLRSIGADSPFEESGDGGRPDWTPVHAELRGNEVYVG